MKHATFARLVAPLALALMAALGSAESLWTPQEIAEIDGFSELDGTMMLKFKDAVSGQPIKGLVLEVNGETSQGNADGVVEFPASNIENIVDKDLPFTATAPGYIPLEDRLRIRVGTILSKRFLMTKGMLLNQARFVLEWDRRPADLDAHLVGPGFHVSYWDMRTSSGNATLDRDARSGYGPETITLLDIKRDAQYLYSINNYSGESAMKNVKITVYLNNSLGRVIFLPELRDRTAAIVRIDNGRVEYLAP